MEIHMRQFDGLTFGMDVEASNPAFRRMKNNAYTGKVKPRGWINEKTARCVKAADVAAMMGEAGWLVRERYMETISWGENGQTHYIVYEEEAK